MCKMKTYTVFFFHFFKILILWVVMGWKGKKWTKMTKNSVCLTPYHRNRTSYDCGFWYTCVKWWYLQQFVFHFWVIPHQMEYLLPQNAFHQISQLSWFFQTIWNPVRNSKNEGSRELFLPENDFQNSSTNFFSKKHQYFIFLHMPFYIWTQYNIKIVLGTYNFLSFIFLELLILER